MLWTMGVYMQSTQYELLKLHEHTSLCRMRLPIYDVQLCYNCSYFVFIITRWSTSMYNYYNDMNTMC